MGREGGTKPSAGDPSRGEDLLHRLCGPRRPRRSGPRGDVQGNLHLPSEAREARPGPAAQLPRNPPVPLRASGRRTPPPATTHPARRGSRPRVGTTAPMRRGGRAGAPGPNPRAGVALAGPAPGREL